MDEKYICPCGLICTHCLFYKPEIYETARKLRDHIKNAQLDIFLSSISENQGWKVIADHLNADQADFDRSFNAFENFKQFMNTLERLCELQCKSTCRESGGCTVGGKRHRCEAVKCVESKAYEGCWQCPENNQCPNLLFVKKVYGNTITETFEAMAAGGGKAVAVCDDNYYAWQRNKQKNSDDNEGNQ